MSRAAELEHSVPRIIAVPICFWPHRGRFDAQFSLIAEGGTVKPGPWSHLAHHRPSQSHLKIPPPTTHRRLAGILENIPPSFIFVENPCSAPSKNDFSKTPPISSHTYP